MKTKTAKKPFIFTITLAFILILTGCGKSNKQTLIDYYHQQAELKSFDISTQLKAEGIEMPEGTGNSASVYLISKLIAESEFKSQGTFAGTDFWDESDLKIFDQTLPMEWIGNKKQLFLKLDYLNSLNRFANLFNGQLKTSVPLDLTKFKGKYVDLLAVNKYREKNQDYNNNASLVAFHDILQGRTKLHQAQTRALITTIKSLPESAFSKKNNIISVKLHKDDVNRYQKALKKDDKALKSILELGNRTAKDFKTCDVTINYDEKKSNLQHVIFLEPHDGGKIKFKLKSTIRKNKRKPKKIPAESIMPVEEFLKITEQTSE